MAFKHGATRGAWPIKDIHNPGFEVPLAEHAYGANYSR